MSFLRNSLSLVGFVLVFGCEPSTANKVGTGAPATTAPVVAVAPAVAPAPPPTAALAQPVTQTPPATDVKPAEAKAVTAPVATKPDEKPKSLREALKIPEHIKELRSKLLEAQTALAAGDKAKALDLLEDVLALDQMHLQGAKLKAEILCSLGQYDKALEALAGLLKNNPMEYGLVQEKARILLEKGDAKEAIKTLEAILVQDLPLLGARYLRAVAAAAAGDRDGALSSLEDAVARGFLSRPMIEKEKGFNFLKGEARYGAVLAKLKGIEENSQRAMEVLKALETDQRMPAAGPADFGDQINTLLKTAKLERGENAPLDLVDVEGKPLRSEDFKGKVLLVQCWGTWSDDSRKMIPELIRLRDEYKSKGVELVALSYETAAVLGEEEEMARGVRAYQKDFKFDVPCAIMNQKQAISLYVLSFPTLLVYGVDGKLYSRAPGFKPYHVLKGMVDIMLQEKPGSGVAKPLEPEKKD